MGDTWYFVSPPNPLSTRPLNPRNFLLALIWVCIYIHRDNLVDILSHWAGQSCTAGSRIYVQEGIYAAFLEGFTKVAETLAQATGGPFEEGVRHGPQVSAVQYEVRGSMTMGQSSN